MKQLKVMGFGSPKLMETCKGYVKSAFEYGCDAVDDHFIIEAAIEAVFGEEQAEWIWNNLDDYLEEPIKVEFV